MDVLRAQLLKIQQQLAGLNASQKMLTASLVAIMIMTMLWWARYAGTAETEALFEHAVAPVELARIKTVLDSRNFKTSMVGDRLMIPASRRAEALAFLALDNALPSDASSAWDDMIKQMSPWDTSDKTRVIQNHMRERMIGQVIASYFPGIAKANVILTPDTQRRIGGGVVPTASVQLVTRGSEFNPQRLVDATAATVASAVPGLSRSSVSVTVDGKPMRARDAHSTLGGGDYYEQVDALEKKNAEKISTMLGMNALVAVTVDIETVASEETREMFDPTGTLVKEKTNESTTENTQSASPLPPEAGAASNATLTLSQGGTPSGNTTSKEVSKSTNEILPGRSQQRFIRPAGKPTVLTAAVRLPRSHFVKRFKGSNPSSAAEPSDAQLQPMIDAELASVKDVVLKTVNLKSDENLSVGMYDDGDLPLLAATEATAASGMTTVVTGHMREIVLGVLAVISLFMVSTIVKKGTPTPILPPPAPERQTPRLAGGEDVAGIVAGDVPPTLDGMELDEDSAKAQQVVEQVAAMVKEDPDSAASLVKRWLNRT